MLNPNIFSGIKTVQDFNREREEFEYRKRQREMQDKVGAFQLEQMQKAATMPSLPFEGTGLEVSAANEAYKRNLSLGMDDASARQQALDAVLGSKVTLDQMGNPIRRNPIFGMPARQVASMSPSEAMAMPVYDMPGALPPSPRQYDGGMTKEQADAAVLELFAPELVGESLPALEGMGSAKYVDKGSRQVFLPPVPLPQQGQTRQMPEAAQIGVNPADYGVTSPYGQEDLATEAAKAQIAIQKEQELQRMKDVEKAEKESAQAESRRRYGDIMTGDILRALEILKNPSIMPKSGTFAPTGISITTAGRLKALTESITESAAFDRLQDMRENSPTGGAVGALSDSERKALGQTLGNINLQEVEPAMLETNLKRMYNVQMDAIHGTPEQIRKIAPQLGISPEQAAELSFRFTIPTISARQFEEQNNEKIQGIINKYLPR